MPCGRQSGRNAPLFSPYRCSIAEQADEPRGTPRHRSWGHVDLDEWPITSSCMHLKTTVPQPPLFGAVDEVAAAGSHNRSSCPGDHRRDADAGASLGQGWGYSRAAGSANLSRSGRLTTIGSGFERVTAQTVGWSVDALISWCTVCAGMKIKSPGPASTTCCRRSPHRYTWRCLQPRTGSSPDRRGDVHRSLRRVAPW